MTAPMVRDSLQVHESSMGFQGEVLGLGDGDEKLALLRHLLDRLPWDKGSLKLGRTWEEMGRPEDIATISCIPHYTVHWQGKRLNIAGDDGGPGDGQVFTDAYNAFDAAARPMYKFEQPKLTMERVLIEEEPVLIADLVLLSVSVASMGFDGLVLSLTPDESTKLAPLESLLEKLPWNAGSLKLGRTAAEMGNPESYLERSCATFYTVNWRGKKLDVEEETGAPGDGQAFTDAWNAFDAAVRPMYKFEKPKLTMLEPVEAVLLDRFGRRILIKELVEASLLSVVLSSTGFDGTVLSLNDSANLAPLEPLLEKLPWHAGSLKLGRTAAEMGNPESYLERSCATFYTVNWRGKKLDVEEETGAPGDGQVFTDAWNAFDVAARPMYKFDEQTVTILEPINPSKGGYAH